ALMIPDDPTVLWLVMAVAPCGWGTRWFSSPPGWPGGAQPKNGGPPVAGVSAGVPSQRNGSGSTPLDPAPAGNVTVWISLGPIVRHLIWSAPSPAGSVRKLVGSISSTCVRPSLLSVPAVRV